MISSFALVLVDLEFDFRLGLARTLWQIGTVAFLPAVRCAEELWELTVLKARTIRMIPDFVDTQS